jgi:hypothetical protein
LILLGKEGCTAFHISVMSVNGDFSEMCLRLVAALAAGGILAGIGFYFAAGLGTVLTLGTLSVFRWIEGKIPAEFYANFLVRFPREQVMPEAELRRLIAEHGFSVANMSYRIAGQGREFEYQMVLRTLHAANAQAFQTARPRSVRGTPATPPQRQAIARWGSSWPETAGVH